MNSINIAINSSNIAGWGAGIFWLVMMVISYVQRRGRGVPIGCAGLAAMGFKYWLLSIPAGMLVEILYVSSAR